jgi:hypothetical protein
VTDRARRFGLALALFLAPWGFVIANTAYAWATRNGGSDYTGREALALVDAHQGLFRLATEAALVGCLLMVPLAVAAMRVIGDRARRLALAGGVLLAAGYICYFGVVLGGQTIFSMVKLGGPMDDFAAVLDANMNDPWTAWVFLLFVIGNLIGTPLLGTALLRSRVVPVWAAIGVITWAPLHVVGLAVGSEWFEVTGAVLQGLGFAAVGVAWLRLTVRPQIREHREDATMVVV